MEVVPFIRVKGINKSFAEKHVLKDISFDIYKGELFVIVGYSGSGKSTLLRVLAGLELADSGEIYFEDREVSRVPPQERKIRTIATDMNSV